MNHANPSRWSLVAIFSGGVLLGMTLTCSHPRPQDREGSPATVMGRFFSASPAFATTPGGKSTLADIAERAVPGVVNLSAVRNVADPAHGNPMTQDPLFREFFGPHSPWDVPADRQTRSLGSGVVVATDGVILTSAHVVEGAARVDITLSDGRELDGRVTGADSRSDLAVVRIDHPPRDLVAIPLGDSSHARLGDVVLAIGNPFGVGQTITMGIVSATGRSRVGIVDYEDFIQTDAAINPGNSGGALIDMRGELVGINTAILSRSGGYQGIGFAVPTAMAEPIMRSLIDRGEVVRGWLGMMIQELDRDLAAGLDLEARAGIVVSDVTVDGPAARAGVARGDVIRTLDGRPVTSSTWFRNHIASMPPGTRVELGLVRAGDRRAVTVELGRLARGDDRPTPTAQSADDTPRAGILAGVRVQELSEPARRRLAVPRRLRGVLVSQVPTDSAAEQMGLAAGDVILEVNGRPARTVVLFRARAAAARDAVAVLVFRGGNTLYLARRR
ncbi:MAG TPA: Do family serine endopeptidase [Kofleriaceae bacterium]|nr:Do family serine endopeptidase [Kofleriaceae bacterium]